MIENQWYLICVLAELDKQNPLKKKILNKDLVVFKTNSNKIAVLEDRCCHRNVQLSLGYVNGENLVCAYHGWQYGSEGKCACIPSLPIDQPIPKTAKIKVYPVQIKHKCVWVYLGDENKMESASIPPMNEMDNFPMVYNYHYLNADLALVAESLIDPYHINHVHNKSIKTLLGNLYQEKVNFNLEINDTNLTGWYERQFDASIWEKIYFGFQKKVKTHFGFWFPHTSKLDIYFRKRRMIIYEHFYQIDENTISMLQITLWDKIFNEFPLQIIAKPFMLRKSNKIVEEDLIFLENNKQVKQKTGKRDLLIPSDEVTFEFMKIWNRNIKQDESISEEEN
jgi:phenylpropionate dioxygenase-like ring-hydroxylating dioxygenase large terminal subunit